MSDMEQGYLPDEVREWIQREADKAFDGNWGWAAAAILMAAYAAEQKPGDPWVGLDKRIEMRKRSKP